MTEKEILQELIGLIYDCSECEYFDFKYYNYDATSVLGMMEDYEIEDMENFLKKYPYMKCIPYGLLYEMQRDYNSDVLCAGWCGCCSPERLVEFMYDKVKELKQF